MTPRKTARSVSVSAEAGTAQMSPQSAPAADGIGRPDEPALVDDVDLHVEARETRGPADDEEERDDEPRAAEVREPPAVDEEGGRDTEAHDVREGVELLAERRRRARPAGDAPVQAVQDGREEHELRGVLESAPARTASSERYPQRMLPAVKSAGST